MNITLFRKKGNLFLKEISSKKEIEKEEDVDGYLINSSEKEIRSILSSLSSKKEKKKIFVKAKDDSFNRRIIETCKIDYLVSPELNQTKDSLKQRDSGLNHVLAKEAAKRKIGIVINFSEIKNLDKQNKSKIISKIIQNIQICRKTKSDLKIASFAKSEKEINSEEELKSFLFSLGSSSQQASNSCRFI